MNREYRIADLAVSERPREKLEKLGPENLTDAELLALVMRKGTVKEGVLAVAQRLIVEHGLTELSSEQEVSAAMARFDLGTVHACQLIAVFEICRRMQVVEPSEGRGRIKSIEDVLPYLQDMMEAPREMVRALYLSSSGRLRHREDIKGTCAEAAFDAQEILRRALYTGSVAVILAHNHPSGEVVPSEVDITSTAQINEAAEVLGLHLLDHVIVAGEEYYSFAAEGLLKK